MEYENLVESYLLNSEVMKRFYAEPELEIRKYSLSGNGVVTASTPEVSGGNDLNKDDNFDLFE